MFYSPREMNEHFVVFNIFSSLFPVYYLEQVWIFGVRFITMHSGTSFANGKCISFFFLQVPCFIENFHMLYIDLDIF